ncbi:MAG: HVO_0476 family zinc finger protein [Halobacteriales archaeon]|nr:HVO_0476 family zinc finger protein [Halobacteriales archaeon]
MTEQSERVAVACPSCSPGAATVHEVLSTGGGQFTVRCTECDHVHKESPPEEQTHERDVVISQGGESFTATVEVPADERVAVGEEFIVDTEEAIMAVRITSLEVGNEQRVDAARGADVETFWTRAVDNVEVNVTLHPEDGTREETRSLKLAVPGDHAFEVGATETFGDEEFTVERILVRDDAIGYPTDKLDRAGDAVEAKDIKRVYATDETSAAWSAW